MSTGTVFWLLIFVVGIVAITIAEPWVLAVTVAVLAALLVHSRFAPGASPEDEPSDKSGPDEP